MSFFCWYLDITLSKTTQSNQRPFNEFSYYYFVGDSQSSSGRPCNDIYIREENKNYHYNVYHGNERLDIIPVFLIDIELIVIGRRECI